MFRTFPLETIPGINAESRVNARNGGDTSLSDISRAARAVSISAECIKISIGLFICRTEPRRTQWRSLLCEYTYHAGYREYPSMCAAWEHDFSCKSAEKTRDIAPGHSAHLSLKADITRKRLLRFLPQCIDSSRWNSWLFPRIDRTNELLRYIFE